MSEPSNGFERREKGFEAKYLHDEELKFRILVKRNRLFGVWVTEILGYRGEEAKVYIEEIIIVDLQKKHEDDVLHKVLRDLEKAEVQVSEHHVRKKLNECWEEAQLLLMKDQG